MQKHYSSEHLRVVIITLTVLALWVPTIALAAGFQNPLKSDGGNITLGWVIGNIIRWLLSLAAVLALLALVIGGIRLILSSFGNEQEAAKAKRNIVWAIIGLSVVILSLATVQIIGGLLGVF